MSALVPRRATAVWVGLMLATVVTFWIGTDHPRVGGSTRVAAAAAIAIAFLKIHYVGQDFMELRHAHPVLRTSFVAWTVVVGTTTILLLLL